MVKPVSPPILVAKAQSTLAACRARSSASPDVQMTTSPRSSRCATSRSNCWPSSSGAAAPCPAQIAQESQSAREWVGVALKMAGELFLVAREETREVLGVPAPLTRVPGAKPWLRGLANVRGQLLPVLDLRAVPRQRRHARDAQHAGARRQPPRDSRRPDGRRGARLPPLPRVRVHRQTCRRPWCAASAISPARSAAATNTGRCCRCARWSRARTSCARPLVTARGRDSAGMAIGTFKNRGSSQSECYA
jgi:hypothetical protein